MLYYIRHKMIESRGIKRWLEIGVYRRHLAVPRIERRFRFVPVARRG